MNQTHNITISTGQIEQSIDSAITNISKILADGVSQGYLNATAQLHAVKLQKSLEHTRKGASKTLAEVASAVQPSTSVLERIRNKHKLTLSTAVTSQTE